MGNLANWRAGNGVRLPYFAESGSLRDLPAVGGNRNLANWRDQ